MSTITEIFASLPTSTHPVARALHKGDNFKVLLVGFKAGMVFRDHKAHIPSKLTVLQGSVVYKEGDKVVELAQYEEVDIPVEITHSVEALEESLCILSQG
ncbi:hypothetical protein GCM10009119_10420 [Algoriphagus jejuensis]|uniref:Cupin domain-containing protein n=1 Tax=Algoriphagus jejuensis TaxID=419934 RepID=A0ABN1MXT2_9BACT